MPCSVPDTPDWKPYREFVYRGQQNFLNHTSNSEHLLDANVPQVSSLVFVCNSRLGKLHSSDSTKHGSQLAMNSEFSMPFAQQGQACNAVYLNLAVK